MSRTDPVENDPSQIGSRLDAIETRLDELVDLFRRRLLTDRAGERRFEALHEQLLLARKGLGAEFHAPMVRELLLVVDRLESSIEAEPAFESVRDELLDVLVRHGLEELPVRNTFDPSLHEAVARVGLDDGASDGDLVSVRRRGYLLSGRLLRPARVVVALTPFARDSEKDATPSEFGAPGAESHDRPSPQASSEDPG